MAVRKVLTAKSAESAERKTSDALCSLFALRLIFLPGQAKDCTISPTSFAENLMIYNLRGGALGL